MSTRGFVGFVADGTEKIAYNHSDSYPSCLGLDVLAWLRGTHRTVLRQQVTDLRVVAADSEPTDDDVKALKSYFNPNVGGPSKRPTWYQLLRETQGDPAAMLRAGVIEDASNFPGDSLFAEYGYVIDLDANTFEVYVGFQRQKHDKGRFAAREPQESGVGNLYYPVALVASWPLDDLPDSDDFIAATEGDDADAEVAL
jgi:hypothetical protein